MLALLENVFYARMSLMFLIVVIATIVAMAVTSGIYFMMDLQGIFGSSEEGWARDIVRNAGGSPIWGAALLRLRCGQQGLELVSL